MSRKDIMGLSLHSLDDSCSYDELDDLDIEDSDIEDSDIENSDVEDNTDDDEFFTSSLGDQPGGSFRWTDVSKLADVSPNQNRRRLSAGTIADGKAQDTTNNDLDISRRNNFRSRVGRGSNAVLRQQQQEGRITELTPRPRSRRPTPLRTDQRNVTDLGDRISHLLLSPNISPITVICDHRRGRVVGGITQRESPDTRTRKSKQTTSIVDEVTPHEDELEMVYHYY